MEVTEVDMVDMEVMVVMATESDLLMPPLPPMVVMAMEVTEVDMGVMEDMDMANEQSATLKCAVQSFRCDDVSINLSNLLYTSNFRRKNIFYNVVTVFLFSASTWHIVFEPF